MHACILERQWNSIHCVYARLFVYRRVCVYFCMQTKYSFIDLDQLHPVVRGCICHGCFSFLTFLLFFLLFFPEINLCAPYSHKSSMAPYPLSWYWLATGQPLKTAVFHAHVDRKRSWDCRARPKSPGTKGKRGFLPGTPATLLWTRLWKWGGLQWRSVVRSLIRGMGV